MPKNKKLENRTKRSDISEEFQQLLFEMPAPEPSVPLQPAAMIYRSGRVYQISVADLQADPAQPRRYFDQKKLESLVQSVREKGVVIPIIFRVSDEGKLVIVAGERRWRAAAMAGLEKLPAIVNAKGSPELVSLIENVIRCDLNPIELSDALERVKSEKSLLDADLTKIFGWAASTLSEYRSLRKLPASVRDDCRMRCDVPMDVLVLIARLDSEKEMLSAYQNFLAGKETRNSLKKGKSRESVTVERYVYKVEKRFKAFEVDTMSTNDRVAFDQSLESLIATLQMLRKKIGSSA